MGAVSRRDDALHLIPTERRSLTCLVSNPGRIVSHRELMEGMSFGDCEVSIGNLRSCVSRLRKKVEIDPGLPRVIITHHQQGYSFAGTEGVRWLPGLEPS